MAMNKKEFTELAVAPIRDSRNVVISKDNLGFITIAQQIILNEDGRETTVFLKGAIEVERAYLEGLRHAIDVAINKLKKLENLENNLENN